MAVPRPVILGLLGVALIAGLFVITRSSGSRGTVAPEPAPAPRKPSAPARPATAPRVSPRRAPAAPRGGRAASTPALPDATLRPAVEALNRGDVVVLFFSQPGSADDQGVQQAVAGVKGIRGVSVFSATLAQLGAYRPLLSGIGVSQVPAVVVARTGHKSRLIEGFVDASTLRQTIADAQG